MSKKLKSWKVALLSGAAQSAASYPIVTVPLVRDTCQGHGLCFEKHGLALFTWISSFMDLYSPGVHISGRCQRIPFLRRYHGCIMTFCCVSVLVGALKHISAPRAPHCGQKLTGGYGRMDRSGLTKVRRHPKTIAAPRGASTGRERVICGCFSCPYPKGPHRSPTRL